MRENLSAPGNVSDWLKISKQALENLSYYNIQQDPQYARLSARYGYDDYIVVNLRTKDDDRVLLEFDVSDPKLIQQYKTASAQIIRQMQQKQREIEEEKEYGKIPTYSVTDERFNPDDYTIPAYEAEEGDFIERTRFLPDDTLQLKEYRKELDRLESDSMKHSFKKYFNKLWVIWLMLFLIPPFGIFLLWYFHRMALPTRIILTVIFALYFFLIWIGFFGIDTGFNREAIQSFYDNYQYQVTRFFNQLFQPNPAQDVNGVEYFTN